MAGLTRIEIQWIISALHYTANNCSEQANELTGTLKGIALQSEANNRATTQKLEAILNTGTKRIEIK